MLNWNDVLSATRQAPPTAPKRVQKTESEWRAQLDADTYRVTREKGTERAFSGALCSRFEPGIYACVCCHTPLFDSSEKFDSGSGWPSFTQGIQDNVLQHVMDYSHGMQRVEVLCNVCDAHLGHVFPDGPQPSGLRYCINSLSLQKTEKTTNPDS